MRRGTIVVAIRGAVHRERRRCCLPQASRHRLALTADPWHSGGARRAEARGQEAVLAAGIARLEELLATATVVGETDAANGAASIGTVVVVSDRDSGAVDEHLLIGGYEPLIANAASANSPIGRALMGRRAGDDVEVELPRQRTRQLRVVAVRAPG